MTTPGGPYVAELNFATDIGGVTDVIKQATGEMEGSLASLFRYVEQLGSSGGLTELGSSAQRAVAQVTELQAAFARLNAEKAAASAGSFGLAQVLPATPTTVGEKGLDERILQRAAVQGSLAVPLPNNEALVPFNDGTVSRVSLASGKILEVYASQGEAVTFLKGKFSELAEALQATTGVQSAAAASSGELNNALNAQAAGATKAEAAAAKLLATQRALAAGLASGEFTRVGGPSGPIRTPEGLFSGTTGKPLNPLQTSAAEERDAILAGQAQAKAAQEAEKAAEAARTPFSTGIDEALGAAKYVAAYAAVFELVKVIKDGVDETKQFQDGVLALDIALESVGQRGAVAFDGLAKIAAAGGTSPGEGLQIAARGIQAFRTESSVSPEAARNVATESATAAIEAQVLAGGKLHDVQGQLIAGAREFNLGAEGQARVLDAATNAQRNFGGSIGEVLSGLSQVAGLAQEAGFSVEQLANDIGLITSSTNLSGSAAAGDLKRILGGSGSPAFQNALAQVGVNTNQSTAAELTDLAAAYSKLNDAQKNQLVTTLGGRRSAEALIPLLQNGNLLLEANARSLANSGAAEDEYNRRQNTLAGTLRQVAGAAKVLLTDVGNTGLASGFGLVLEALKPMLQLLDEMAKVFVAITGGSGELGQGIRGVAFAVGDLTLALKALELVSGRSFLLGGNFGAKRAAAVVEGEAVAANAAAVTTAESAAVSTAGAATTARFIPGLEGAPEVGAAAGAATGAEAAAAETAALGSAASAASSSLIALLGPAALLGGAFFGIIEVSKALSLHGSENKVQAALTFQGGTSDDLRGQAANVDKLAADIRDGSKGFTGTIADFLSGDEAGRAVKRLKDFSDQLKEQATKIDSSIVANHGDGVFGQNGPQSVEALTSGVKRLATSGLDAAGQVRALVHGFDDLSGAAARLLVATKPGSIALPDGAASFTQSLFQDVIPSAADVGKPKEVGGNDGIFGTGILARKGILETVQMPLSPDNGKEITKEIEAKIGDKKVLGPSDLEDIATIVANGWGLTDPKDIRALHDKILAGLKARAQLDQAGSARAEFLKANPELISAAVQSISAGNQASTSEAQARGASTQELTGVAKANLANLQALANDLKSVGVGITPELTQALQVAKVELYRAFVAHIDELAAAAKAALPSTDKAGAAAIDREATAVKQLANGLGNNTGVLAGSYTTLGQAKTALINGTIDQADKERASAAAVLQQAKADAAALVAEAAAIEADAAAVQDFTDRKPFPGTGDAPSGRAAQLRAMAAALLADASKPPPQVKPIDPSAVATNALAQSAAGAAAAGGDTAAQIAAAANAARQFPGAQVEQDRAAITTAEANLKAQTRGTVAFYQALASLRQAQNTYVQAVLAAQHVGRELSIDLTNPLTVAQEDVRTANAKLSSDRKAKAPADVIQADQLALREAQNRAEQTAFQQNLDQVKTNVDLGRISQAAYLNYLNQQHDHLQAIAHKTYQQMQELNQIDQLLKDAANALSGQFNIGNIKLPTDYEVRRAVQSRAAGTSVTDNRTISVAITVAPSTQASVDAAIAQLTAAVGVDATRTGTRRTTR
ncbi:MAG: phage tail tape measure protein [Oryzihumus sp.]